MNSTFSLVQQYSDAQQSEADNHFYQKLLTIAFNGHVSLALELGRKLGLFAALAKTSSVAHPASAFDVAHESGMKPRFVHEWLCCMACAELIQSDASGNHFWIPEEHAKLLLAQQPVLGETTTPPPPSMEPQQDAGPIALNSTVRVFGAAFARVASVFGKKGPIGLHSADFEGMEEAQEAVMQFVFNEDHLINRIIPAIGLEERLTKGIEVLEIGCGFGSRIVQMALHFPRTRFTGVDCCSAAIRHAQETAVSRLVKLGETGRVDFIVAEPTMLDASWTERFDLVLCLGACNQLPRPDLVMAEAHRCLKPGGVLAIVENNGSGNCHADKHLLGEKLSSYLYALSLFHSLPIASKFEGALQVGAIWDTATGTELLQLAGFKETSAETLKQLPAGGGEGGGFSHLLFIGKK